MKEIILAVALSGLVCGLVVAQQPLADDEALKQLYHAYEPSSKTAEWTCVPTQSDSKRLEGWSCTKGNPRVSITVLLSAQVDEDGTAKTYVVASAVPDDSRGDYYGCHACAPAIGMAVFAWKGSRWMLEAANPACGFLGSYGDSPDTNLTAIGPQKHGVQLSWSDLAQGYAWSVRVLLMPVGSTVKDAWSIQDEQDNEGAYDPDDKSGDNVLYHSSATIKFVPGNGSVHRDYYDIEVVSTGRDRQFSTDKLKDENWTELYRFIKGKYRLLRHTDLAVAKKTATAH